jgi:hypothetical protein
MLNGDSPTLEDYFVNQVREERRAEQYA